MDRRRTTANRPASSEEVQCWSRAVSALSNLSSFYDKTAPSDLIQRVNRLISAWPTDDQLPAEGLDGVMPVYKKLAAGLNDIKNAADREAKALDAALETLNLVIALRTAPEAPSPVEKRNKRPRAPSPAGSAASTTTTMSRGVSVNVPARGSVGPTTSTSKARRDAVTRQPLLQEGRKVAYQPKSTDGAAGEWILAVVTRCVNPEKKQYQIQDADSQDGKPGPVYIANLRNLIPLPDPEAPPNSLAHLDAYPEFPKGSSVIALYPDTSCFYRAEVVASRTDLQPHGRGAVNAKHTPIYKVRFEDDDGQEHSVSAMWVVEYPG